MDSVIVLLTERLIWADSVIVSGFWADLGYLYVLLVGRKDVACWRYSLYKSQFFTLALEKVNFINTCSSVTRGWSVSCSISMSFD